MNIQTLDTMFCEQDIALRERIRTEVRELLSERETLADLEKEAAVRENTMRVAHDVRNPLATIGAICGSLILETQDPEQRERLQLISNQVDQLALALNTAVEGGDGTDDPPVSLNVGDLARSLVNLMQHQTADEVVFHLFLEPDLACRLPELGLTRSLYQLVRNAADALSGRPGGQVLVDCRKDGRCLEIRVLDNGPGLPRELIEGGLRAFSSARSGRALGLSSVERFALALGGHLEFSDSESGGAQVCLVLPMDCLDGAPSVPGGLGLAGQAPV